MTRRPASADRTACRHFISTTDLYNTTADRWSCQLPNRNVCATDVLPMGGPFAFRYHANGSTPCQYIDTTRKAIDCATTLPLSFYILKIGSRLFVLCCRNCPEDDKFRYLIPILRKLGVANLCRWFVGKPVSSSC